MAVIAVIMAVMGTLVGFIVGWMCGYRDEVNAHIQDEIKRRCSDGGKN